MNTTDLFKGTRSSQKINEGIKKTFGKKLNLEGFNLDELQDARNQLRTHLSQMRSKSGFNENLDNDKLHQAQWMLDAINAEISEREEFIVDDINEGMNSNADIVIQDIIAGRRDLYDVLSNPQGREETSAAQMLQREYDEVAYHAGLHPDDDFEQIEELLIRELEEKYGAAESINTYEGKDMKKVNEGEIQQASAIVTAKTMVDRVSRWIDELSSMENDTLLQLGDSIRDEMGQEAAKQFISSVAPTINQALMTLKTTREELSSGVRTLTGEENPMDMLGAEDPMAGDEIDPFADDEIVPAEPDAMVEPADEFGAADAAVGGAEAAGRMKRESINRTSNLMKMLAG